MAVFYLWVIYHQLTRANMLSSGLNSRWFCHCPWLAPASLRPLPHQRPFLLAGKSFGVFRNRKRRLSEADEAAGLPPGNEENEAGRCFSSEKPCLPLSTDGIFDQLKKLLQIQHQILYLYVPPLIIEQKFVFVQLYWSNKILLSAPDNRNRTNTKPFTL